LSHDDLQTAAMQSLDLTAKPRQHRRLARAVSATPLGDPPLELKDIKILIDLMKKNDLSVFQMEKDGFKILLKKGQPPAVNVAPPAAPAVAAGQLPPSAASAAPAPATDEPQGEEIVSPMVGTFYQAMSPDAPAYVKVGQSVQADTVVCIIEAMKVMNEIKAEIAGVVAEILVENGKPVQFGQPLFRLK
jgi:acetyl-CoA carboxylase biotin carboxyl carrier protein